MIVNWLDIILIIVLLTTLVLGLIKGLIRQVIGIVAAVGGLILAAFYYPDAAGLLRKLIRNERWADCLGFLLIFFGCLLVGWLIGWLLSKLMKGPFKFINHLLGGVLGMLKGVLVCGVIVFALLVFPIAQSALERSTLSPYCLAITKAMVQVVPAELKDKFRVAYQDIIGRIGSHGKKI